MLVSVTAPHFCAGIIVDVERDEVIEAAPILRWTQGKSYRWLTRYFARKRWRVHELREGGWQELR